MRVEVETWVSATSYINGRAVTTFTLEGAAGRSTLGAVGIASVTLQSENRLAPALGTPVRITIEYDDATS